MSWRLPQRLVAPLARRKFAQQLRDLDLQRFRLRIAHTVDEYEDAFKLVHAAYVFQGFESVRSNPLRIIPQHVLPESTVLVAYEGPDLVGTMTIASDSPAGLPLDSEFPYELGELRNQQLKLVEYGALAVVKRCWHSGATALLNMAAHWFATNVLRATHCVVGVNPRLAPYYQAVFDFHSFAAAQGHGQLKAPVQGLLQDLEAGAQHQARYFRQPLATGLRYDEHACGELPPCIQMPRSRSLGDLVRWKLPRDVFQELFISRSDRLTTLDPVTQSHLANWRSLRTRTTTAAERAPRAQSSQPPAPRSARAVTRLWAADAR